MRQEEKFTKGYEELKYDWGSVVCPCVSNVSVLVRKMECVCRTRKRGMSEREGVERQLFT